MFPLTRQSFRVVLGALVALSWFVIEPAPLCAQNGGDPDADATAPNDTPSDASTEWTRPAWYMDSLEVEKFSREMIRISQLLRNNNPNSAQADEIRKIAHFFLSQMTFEELRDSIPQDVRQRLNAMILTPSNRPAAREIVMNEVIDQAPVLLSHPDPVVRLNMVLLLTELSIQPADFASRRPAAPYAPAYEPLIAILQDSSQIREARIVAARGLSRILKDDQNNTLTLPQRSEIAEALVRTLGNIPVSAEDADWWFRLRMVESLGYVERLDNVNGDPIVVDTLLDILRNPKERILVRSQAALSLSQLPYASSSNLTLITHEICKFMLQLTQAFQKKPDAPYWRDYYSRLYLSFRPQSSQEAEKGWGLLYQVKKGGLGSHETYVNSAFERAFPIFKSVLEHEQPVPVPSSALKTFEDWVKNNEPTDRRATPASEALPQ